MDDLKTQIFWKFLNYRGGGLQKDDADISNTNPISNYEDHKAKTVDKAQQWLPADIISKLVSHPLSMTQTRSCLLKNQEKSCSIESGTGV